MKIVSLDAVQNSDYHYHYIYIFYVICYKISDEKFEKYLQTYKDQTKDFRHTSY